MKFKPQRVEKVNGNDFIYNLFGPNTNWRHKNFEALIVLSTPLIEPSNKTKFPNWKVQPIFYVGGIYI